MDIIDEVNEIAALEMNSLDIQARKAASEIPIGEPGMCQNCEEHSKRLVTGLCAPCRDIETGR